MIDFIEYIVSELKSKRLSKANALSLIRQYSLHSSGATQAPIIHPLLHSNTSDLSQQSYSMTFSGDEFFLKDHQIRTDGRPGQRVLPGVAYLEMARAAVENALPSRQQSGALELRNIVWARPIVVAQDKEVTIALFANDEELRKGQIDFEIYSLEADAEGSPREIIHCQGQAVFSGGTTSARLDVEQLKAQMVRGRLEASGIYPAYGRMGIDFGPAHQAVTAIYQGERQLLAQISLPAALHGTQSDYLLHPSLLDGALQASIGLLADLDQLPSRPSLPFALESLSIVSACTPEMVAWVRYSPGSKPDDRITKLDIDLCDKAGNVCVQIRGFTSRTLTADLGAAKEQDRETGALFATPVWEPAAITASSGANQPEYTQRHVVLCEVEKIDIKQLEALVPQSRCRQLQAAPQKNIAARYKNVALACFELIRKILKDKPRGKVLVQIVIANHEEQTLFAGLSGLLKTASLENPLFNGQIILTGPRITAEELAGQLRENQAGALDSFIKYERGSRQVLRLVEVPASREKTEPVFKDNGVYLITGGLGGLGVLFAKEILKQTSKARIILTGRSALTAGKKAILEQLSARGSFVSYRTLDVADQDQVRQLIATIKKKYSQLSGIIHSAGIISDCFILKKKPEEFSRVLAPKVAGTFNLDEASKEIDLDFLVLFSSGASLTGNNGQSDYATANGFLDQFAAYRNQLVAAGQRHGKTLSVNWPLWQEGGMRMDQASRELMRQSTGMYPMQTATGLDAFYRSMKLQHSQMLVVEGDLPQLRQALFAGTPIQPDSLPSVTQAERPLASGMDADGLAEKTEEYLRRQLSGLLKYPAHKIDPQAPLEKYGIDSILAMDLTNHLEKTFGPLSKTLFFEYQTIRELTHYFIASHPALLAALLADKDHADSQTRSVSTVSGPVPATQPGQIPGRRLTRQRNAAVAPYATASMSTEPIAIIGLSGRYPEATDIAAYWHNLREGKDCIVEVPKERWDWREYYTEDRGKEGHHYSKWGGFIPGVDEFDPRFFNISPLEAESIDPQERLFLQHAWMAVEDAGYTRPDLQIPHGKDLAGQVGVYVGVMYSEYQLFGAQASVQGKRMGVAGSYASIANRVSYMLNLHGPSMTLDTMCSSSLSAIHVACQDLKLGRTDLAIAGGVNVSIHPNKYLVISAGQFISSDGHCQSFGEGGDGYIPGEGVGTVVLKRLSEAERDGNHIYGIIKGSALNHGGKTNGYTVPNPKAQSSAINLALAESNTDPRHISYIEAHGTGTRLGDPIEIAALTQAFRRHTEDTGFCRIGSAKSNIGHCESAAGIAGITKILLQMQHEQIVPSLHSTILNPHIDFEKTPFIVNQTLRTWERPVIDDRQIPRTAGISSFGAGGSNAHIIVQEYTALVEAVAPGEPNAKVIIPLSARTAKQLKQKAGDLLAFIRTKPQEPGTTSPKSIDLPSMAYTLQVGREAMDERLGFLVGSVGVLADKLQAYIDDEQDVEDAYQGRVEHDKDTLSLFSTDADLQRTVQQWAADGKLSKLLDLWTKGLQLDWNRLYGEVKPRRISLPTYPFAKERYWIDTVASKSAVATAVLHPLLHLNTSDLTRQSYSSTFSGAEFFLTDHQVKLDGGSGQKVLPAVAYLEMARAAVEKAAPRQESGILELHNTVWAQPIVVTASKQVTIALFANDNDHVDFEICSLENEQEIVHCQGRATFSYQPAPARLDLEELKKQMGQGRLEGAGLYPIMRTMGLQYGPAHQAITFICQGEKQLLAQLRLPTVVAAGLHDYLLHPSLMDGALQASIGLIGDLTGISSQPSLPFALDTLRIVASCAEEMSAWVRYSQNSKPEDKVIKLDIDLCDKDGNVCVQMQGFASRVLSAGVVRAGEQIGTLLAAPVWEPAAIAASARRLEYSQHQIILCEMPQVEANQLERLIPLCRCLKLQPQQVNIAERYSEAALACFELIRKIMIGKPQGRVLVQLVIANDQEQTLFAGLSGLFKTAALENPLLSGQIILTDPQITAGELAGQLQSDQTRPHDTIIKHEQGARHVAHWQELEAGRDQPAVAFKDRGVYLVTGGLGALGLLFAEEIFKMAANARVIVTGRSELTAEKQAVLDRLSEQAGQLVYRQLDLGDLDQVRQLISAVTKEYGRLDGIIHSAGMISDNFILKKTAAEFSRVLAPKVAGTVHLDEASKNLDLDFLVLFSSVTGAMGNAGQADYATANGFMDQFASYRNRLVAAGERQGHTLSINWPLWREGGMSIDQAGVDLLQQATGVQPLQTAAGMQAFYRSLALRQGQALVMEGDLAKMRRILLAEQAAQAAPAPLQVSETVAVPATEDLVAKAKDYLRRQFAALLKLSSHEIDPKVPLENYGIDSILAMKLTSKLEETFGSLSKTLFFEYQTVAELAGYFAKTYPHIVQENAGSGPAAVMTKEADRGAPVRPFAPALRAKNRFLDSKANARTEIAIVGLAGKYPQADTLEQFWENLKSGRDCVTEIPAERWDHRLYFDPARNQAGKSYSKWGGFLNDVDKFDPLFFNISPKEAELIDPQERLFIETVWQTIEDAGYSKESISANRVGVFVGVMYGHYELYAAEAMLAGNSHVPTSSFASIANRVSYFFNFRGPSIALDTMCSSSLTAIHLACEEIRKGEIDAAVAGGVNVSIHPQKYLNLSQGNFAASDGRCRSFGKGGDGYVPGEGVGAILLKPLENALRDGDHIYAVIKSSAINHGGKTNGYTVPNPNAQAEVILEALRKADIDPKTLGYIETHGTGTSLGDPIEITGLTKAFDPYTQERHFCPIGSVKSNIGHLESAAGIAAVTKALLQIKHGELVPSLHADPLNPNINFEESPFYVETRLAKWERPAGFPRRVGVSSFGAGGANAHLILEEYADAREPGNERHRGVPEAFVLSAKDQDTLCRYAERFVDLLEQSPGMTLMNLAYTSQVGRTPMNERLAIVTANPEELKDKLKEWIALRKGNGSQSTGSRFAGLADLFQGNVKHAQSDAAALLEGKAGKVFLQAILENRDLVKIAKLWVSGVDIDWSLLYRHANPRRVSLPTYPFAKDRYWIDVPLVTTRLPLVSTHVAQKSTRETAPVAAPEVTEKIGKMQYTPRWTVAALTAPESAVSGPVLVLDTTDELYLALKGLLGESPEGNAPILVRLERSYQAIEPAIFTIDPEQEAHFDQLVEDLKKQGRLPRQIIHHGFGPGGIPEKKEDAVRQLNYGLYTLFYLCKALMKQKYQAPLQILSVCSCHAQATAPEHAALGGFFKTLTLENPKYLAKVIEIQNDPERPEIAVGKNAGLVLDELRDKNWDKNEIRYEFQKEKQAYIRYVRELAPCLPAQDKKAELPLKQQGVYIVSGGLGGLGFVFSEYLAKNFQATLVLFGRSALKAEQEEKLNRLRAYNTEILYLQADVSKFEDMEAVVKSAKSRFSQINGVIHSAGINRDSFILKKTKEEMEQVLAVKMFGALHLDQATREEPLDLFVMFSSVAGVMGNVGQCDYAYGNHFLDSFAESRENLRREQKRFGKTLSINWPYWEEGGMTLSQNDIAVIRKQTGICPLPTHEGIQYWEEFLRSDLSQGIALYGVNSKIASYLAQESLRIDQKPAPTKTMDPAILLEKTEAYLKTLIGAEIKLAPERIDSRERFESFGVDSMMIARLNATLEGDLGALSKTLMYQYESIGDLAAYLTQEARQSLILFFNLEDPASGPEIQAKEASVERIQEAAQIRKKYEEDEQIAIIGVHGHYPHSKDMDEYWENLKLGRDLIDLVPPSRWDYEEFYHSDPQMAAEGKIYCKWGGFLNDVDKFDPHFFNISAEEARIMDPQERLFLKSVWAAIEDAGYTRDSLKRLYPKAKSADVGVFVGVTTNSYHLLAAEEWSRGNMVTPSALPWSIANRVSYFFDFQGPSLPVDTACSSSLVALHLACESLKRQECRVAIAGGVNLYLHPSKFHSFCKRRMVSLGGKCRSFGAGDDGFVPGEGVGTVVLKPLSKAIEDRDHIYAVIQGSAFDHSGRANGYSAPNPNSQANLIDYTLRKAQVHPESIGYIEGHGTGTQLGDSLEIVALTQAFQKQSTKRQFCPVGSVKANVGHSESAAGIAGVAKILLQMKHRQLAPSINSEEVNPNIDFENSPFYLQHQLGQWETSPLHPRRALINAFGAGGVNACVILEEYETADVPEKPGASGPYLVVLSAGNEDRLREYVARLLRYAGKEQHIDLANLSYTLQVGREAMPERMAIIVSERKELIARLSDWAEQKASPDVYRGSLDPRRAGRKSSKKDGDLLKPLFETRDLVELAQTWVTGTEVDWEKLYPQNKPFRVALPTYPFAEERYWVSDASVQEKSPVLAQKNGQLHPLISYNSSTLREVSFSSLLSEKEFYATDHKVNEEMIFPGSGYLEMACILGNIAGEQKVSKIRDIVWIKPLSFRKGSQMVQSFLKPIGNIVEYRITSLDDDYETVVHSEGRLTLQNDAGHSPVGGETISIQKLKEQCSKPLDGAHYYTIFKKFGFDYGSAFQTIQEFYVNGSYALSKLKLADHLKADFDQYILHPSIIDGALQTVIGLVGGVEPATPYLPFAIDEVEIIRPLPHTCYAYVEFADSGKQQADLRKFNIQLLNEGGEVLIRLKNFYVRALGKAR